MTDESANLELVASRKFNAPRQQLWDCMTMPEHLSHFYGPVGMSSPLENINIDLRVGGTFDITMVNDETGDEFSTPGTYNEIVEPQRLAWTASSPEMSLDFVVTFDDLGNEQTEVSFFVVDPPPGVGKMAGHGFSQSLDKLETYLAA